VDAELPSERPSEELLKSRLAVEVSWKDFTRRYQAELLSSPEVDARNRTIKNHGQKFTLRLVKHLAEHGPVTLLCHCAEDEKECHRHLLARLIARA
jgi:uncharacterized protein YeaO (DUF488 family)